MLKRQEYLLCSRPKGFRTVRNLSTFLFTSFWLSASFGFIQIVFPCASFLITQFCTLNPLHVAGNASIKTFQSSIWGSNIPGWGSEQIFKYRCNVLDAIPILGPIKSVQEGTRLLLAKFQPTYQSFTSDRDTVPYKIPPDLMQLKYYYK